MEQYTSEFTNPLEDVLTEFDKKVLAYLGITNELPGDHNPIVIALRDDPDFLLGININKRQMSALSRLCVICQVSVFNHSGGPEEDGKPKALRRHWYTYFKTEFAQPFSEQMGEDLQGKKWGTNWAQRISSVYAELVRSTNLTYLDLWVNDGSRMIKTDNARLTSGTHIIVAVEKDSLFDDFSAAAQRLGARALYSGKGKTSLAATEKVLRQGFSWSSGWEAFSEEQPLIVIHISDWDYDGEAVIGPTFAEQCRVYTPHVIEARVGINPDQVTAAGYDPADKWYQVSLSNKGAQDWAEAKAVDGKYGFEVEAIRVAEYQGMLVDTLLKLVSFDELDKQLRTECRPDTWDAAMRAQQAILEQNELYQKMKAAITSYENELNGKLNLLAENNADRVPDPEGNITAEEYRQYVASDAGYGWNEPWRPFSQQSQTYKLANILLEDFGSELSEVKIDIS